MLHLFEIALKTAFQECMGGGGGLTIFLRNISRKLLDSWALEGTAADRAGGRWRQVYAKIKSSDMFQTSEAWEAQSESSDVVLGFSATVQASQGAELWEFLSKAVVVGVVKEAMPVFTSFKSVTMSATGIASAKSRKLTPFPLRRLARGSRSGAFGHQNASKKKGEGKWKGVSNGGPHPVQRRASMRKQETTPRSSDNNQCGTQSPGYC